MLNDPTKKTGRTGPCSLKHCMVPMVPMVPMAPVVPMAPMFHMVPMAPMVPMVHNHGWLKPQWNRGGMI